MTKIAVVGAGTMGVGIAYVSLLAGYEVALNDSSPETLVVASERVDAAFVMGIARGKVSEADVNQARRRLMLARDIDVAVADADIVIEAAPEVLTLKQSIFARVATVVSPATLLATNTSSLSITHIATAVSYPERLVGMHFFNPVAAMKLVEIVRGEATGPMAVEAAKAIAHSLGKTSIVVGDSPGFATSRLGVVLGLEAMRMLEQGVASAGDIDTAMVLGYNHPVGPLRLTDIVGLDVRLAVANRLHSALGDATYAPPDILKTMVAEGKLGKKSGEGFYNWAPKEPS